MEWRKRNALWLVLAGLLLFISLLPGLAEAATPKVTVNGRLVYFPDVKPVNISGRVLVPVRFIAEAPELGATVTYEAATRMVTIRKNERVVVMWPDNHYVFVSGVRKYLDVAPRIINGRTMVPLRFLSETFGADVYWNASSSTVVITTGDDSQGGDKVVLGYYYVGATSEMVSQQELLTDVAFHWYTADASGNLKEIPEIPGNSQQIEDVARSSGLRLQASVALFDRDTLHRLLGSVTARNKLISDLKELAVRDRLQAINIDFEGVSAADRDNYINFLADLRPALKESGVGLMAAVPAKDGEVAWYAAYDYAAIARCVDQMVIMAYDYNWRGGEAGPIAPLDWVTDVVDYALNQVAPGKILLGLGIYGYDWPDGQVADALSYQECLDLAAYYGAQLEWDNTANLPHFSYVDDKGMHHTVWFENGDSLKAKLDLARAKGLAGVAIWRLGIGFPGFWDNMAGYLN